METILSATAREKIYGHQDKKRQVCERLKKLIVADGMALLDFSTKDKNGFVEYEKGLFVRDITSYVGAQVGLTSLHLMVKYDMEISSHEHIDQNQYIYVKNGQIYDLRTKITYVKGEGFPVSKKLVHHLKYFSGSEYLITFMPNLEEK